MPFENVHGNGGLLTTVGDLLRWNSNFAKPRVGDEAFVSEQQEPGRLRDGRQHNYGLGLYIRDYQGVREVSHSGSTAGYQAYLARYPEQRLSVAVLCNVTSATPGRYAHEVADMYLGPALTPRKVVPAALKVQQIEPFAGLYRNTITGQPLVLALQKESLSMAGQPLIPISPTTFEAPGGGASLEFGEPGRVRMLLASGLVEDYEKVQQAQPDAKALAELAGLYTSDEADALFKVEATDRGLSLVRSPDTMLPLWPLYADAFASPMGMVRFNRDATGRIAGFSISEDRVWDLRFRRQ